MLIVFLRLFSECDGVILNTSEHVEPEAVSVWRSWLNPRPLYVLGPLTPVYKHCVQEVTNEVELFLDEMFVKYGENSVVYVRKLCCYCLSNSTLNCTQRSHLERYSGQQSRRK